MCILHVGIVPVTFSDTLVGFNALNILDIMSATDMVIVQC